MDKLDHLYWQCEKLLALLKDRQPGIATWNEFLVDRCQEITNLLLSGGSACPKCKPQLNPARDPKYRPLTWKDNPPPTGAKED